MHWNKIRRQRNRREGGPLDSGIDATTLEELFQLVLGRPVGDQSYIDHVINSELSVRDILSGLLSSEEMACNWRHIVSGRGMTMAGSDFLVPKHLAITRSLPKRVLLIGSCAIDLFHKENQRRYPQTEIIYLPFNNGMELPNKRTEDLQRFDFQIIQIPQRGLMPDGMYIGSETTADAARQRFEEVSARLSDHLEKALAYCRQCTLQSFVMNFLPPQQNTIGRLQSRFSFENPVFFIEELNRAMYKLVEAHSNCYVVDIEEIASSVGKRFVQDDIVAHIVHGSMLVGIQLTAEDGVRLEETGDPNTIYNTAVADYDAAVYDTVLAARRSLLQLDAIKLVVFDLDDTLWRGVLAEKVDAIDALSIEGWPLGILEAAYYLAERGVMLAIVSKNDEHVVRSIWERLYGHLLPLDRFVATRISWRPKPESIAEIIELTNVGTDAVLFVDDNPAERAHVREALPGIRTLDVPLAEWRRTLLWAPELQPPFITPEAAHRTRSIQQKEDRDVEAKQLDRGTFLAGLKVEISTTCIFDAHHPRFPRCFELINKTNQFNTTGQRWSQSDLGDLFIEGGCLYAFDVKDKYSSYGIVAIGIVKGREVLQYLMSCRVFGLGIEAAAASRICAGMRAEGNGELLGSTRETGKNGLALTFFEQAKFKKTGEDKWLLPESIIPPMPTHVLLE